MEGVAIIFYDKISSHFLLEKLIGKPELPSHFLCPTFVSTKSASILSAVPIVCRKEESKRTESFHDFLQKTEIRKLQLLYHSLLAQGEIFDPVLQLFESFVHS